MHTFLFSMGKEVSMLVPMKMLSSFFGVAASLDGFGEAEMLVVANNYSRPHLQITINKIIVIQLKANKSIS